MSNNKKRRFWKPESRAQAIYVDIFRNDCYELKEFQDLLDILVRALPSIDKNPHLGMLMIRVAYIHKYFNKKPVDVHYFKWLYRNIDKYINMKEGDLFNAKL